MYNKLHERGILHGSPSLTNIWLPRPKPVKDPRDPSFYICNWSRARCVDPKSKRSNGSFEPMVSFIPTYTEPEAFWEIRELKFNLDYKKARAAELKKFAHDFATLLSAAEMRRARIDSQQSQDAANTPETGGLRHNLGKLFKKLVDIPIGPQVHELRDSLTGEIRVIDNRLDWLWTEREAQELNRLFSMSIHNARKSRNVHVLRVAETVAEAAKKHLEMHRLSNMSDRQLTVMPIDLMKECDTRWYEWDPSFPDRESAKGKQRARDDVYESDIAQFMLWKHDMIQHDDYRGRSQRNAFGLPSKSFSASSNSLYSADDSLEGHDVNSDPELGEQGNKTGATQHFFSDNAPTSNPGHRAPTPMPTLYMSSGLPSATPVNHKRPYVMESQSLPAHNDSPPTSSAQVPTPQAARRSSGPPFPTAKSGPRLSSETLEQKKQRLKYLEEALVLQAREVEKVVAVGEAVAAFSNPEQAFEELDVFIERSKSGSQTPQRDAVVVSLLAPTAPIVSSSNTRRGSAPPTTGPSQRAATLGPNPDDSPSPMRPQIGLMPLPSSPDLSASGSATNKTQHDTRLAVQVQTSGHETPVKSTRERFSSPTSSASSSSTAVGTPVISGTASSGLLKDAQKPNVEAAYWDAGLTITPCSTKPPTQNNANKGMARGYHPDSTPTEDVFTHMDWEGSVNSYSRDSPRWALDEQPPRPIASDGKTHYYPLSTSRGFCQRGRRTEAVGRTDVEGFQLPLGDAVRAVFQCILNAKEANPECPSSDPLMDEYSSPSQGSGDAATVVNASQGASSTASGVDYTMWDESFPNRVPILDEDGTLETPADAELSFGPNSPPAAEIDDEWEAACQRDIVNRRKGLILNQRVIRLMLWMAAKREARDVAFYKGIPTAVLSKQAAEVVRHSRAHVRPYDREESQFQRGKRRLEKEIIKFAAISRAWKDEADRKIAPYEEKTKSAENIDSAPDSPPQASSPTPSLCDLREAATGGKPTPIPTTSPALPQHEQTSSIPPAFRSSFHAFHNFSPFHASAASPQTTPVRPPAPPVANPFSAFGKPFSTTSPASAFHPWSPDNSTTVSAEYSQQQPNPFAIGPTASWLSKFIMQAPRGDYHNAKFYFENNVIICATDMGEVVDEIEVEHIVREGFDMEDGSIDELAYETPGLGLEREPSWSSPTKRARDESDDDDDDDGDNGSPGDTEHPRRAKRYRCARRRHNI